MKAIKYILSTIILIALIWSCTKVEDNFDFVSTAKAPANISALFGITQDNTGMVTITPNGEGATSYEVSFGDDTPEAATVKQGQSVKHTYAEGNYQVKIAGTGITGLKTEITQDLVVSFKAPENLMVLIENDPGVSKKVNVKANADFATFFEVYFGEAGFDEPVTANIGETASYVYQEVGTYSIRVVAKGGAIQTTEYTEDFVVTAILQPLVSVAKPPSRLDADVISIFSDAYTSLDGVNFYPNWGQSTTFSKIEIGGDTIIQYGNLNYQGIDFNSAVDASLMEFLHIDIWTTDAVSIDIYPLPGGVQPADERFVTKDLVADQWNSFNIPLSDFTDQGLALNDLRQFKFVGSGTVFVDNIYFHKAPSVASVITGTWKLAPEAGALMVGPNPNDGSWWSSSEADVSGRACLFDDTYVFSSNGDFSNVLGTDTWIEGWQGGSDACGTPVAPHDGTVNATYSFDGTAGTVTLTGKGAYLGIPKPFNGGELTNPADAPASITYDITLSDNDNTMTLVIFIGSGYWTYKLVKDESIAASPIEGTWKMAPEAGALMVGPNEFDGSWWSSSEADVTGRACFFDDEYVFSSNGSFSNVLGTDTWIEGWQGGSDACGTPVAPHDGTAIATYTFDETAGTVTINGVGAFLGIPKPFNGGELTIPADAPASITYDITLSDNDNTMTLSIFIGTGYWTYKLVK